MDLGEVLGWGGGLTECRGLLIYVANLSDLCPATPNREGSVGLSKGKARGSQFSQIKHLAPSTDCRRGEVVWGTYCSPGPWALSQVFSAGAPGAAETPGALLGFSERDSQRPMWL